jgi:hypothetical protein
MLLVVERPQGQKLSEIVAQRGALSERYVIDYILKPLNEALATLSKYNINHGCINPDTIYLQENTLKIKEAVSEPSGYSQLHWYEPPERLFAMPAGKGSGNAAADSYALAVLCLYLIYGKLPVEKLTRQQFENRILQLGSYHAFTQNIDVVEPISDLMRGALNDNIQERWTHEQIAPWIDGKRYNLILPSIPRESVRTFHFDGEDYFNYRALAQALYSKWDTAKLQLASGKLVKWMETNATKTEAADAMSRVLSGHLDALAGEKPLNDDELCKVIAILDPMGPMRYKEVCINIDGMGKALAEAIRQKNNTLRQQILTLIDIGHPAFLSNLIGKTANVLITQTLWQMQPLRPLLKLKTLGFGLERIVYSLNPSLTCQSSLVLPYHPANLSDVMTILDTIATGAMKKSSLIDAHLAAYIAAKLDIQKDIKIYELAAHPDLMSDTRLVMLKLLMQAQHKQTGKTASSPPPYKGLAIWMAATILPIAEKIHQKSTREALIRQIKKAASTGYLDRIAQVMFSDRLFAEDRAEFERAKALYKFHEDSVIELNDKKKLERGATLHGRYLSVAMGYIVLCVALYFSLSSHLHL